MVTDSVPGSDPVAASPNVRPVRRRTVLQHVKNGNGMIGIPDQASEYFPLSPLRRPLSASFESDDNDFVSSAIAEAASPSPHRPTQRACASAEDPGVTFSSCRCESCTALRYVARAAETSRPAANSNKAQTEINEQRWVAFIAVGGLANALEISRSPPHNSAKTRRP